MVHHAVAASIASMIVVEVAVAGTVGTAVAVAVTMTATVDLLATMIVSDARMDVVMITALEELTDMHRAGATIVTAVAAVTTTVVAVTPMLVVIVGALMLRTAMLPQERLVTRTVEVETKTTVLTIGTPVDRLRSANPFRCGALCQIMRSNLSSGFQGLELEISIHGEDGSCGFLLWCSMDTASPVSAFSMVLLPALSSEAAQRYGFPSNQKSRHLLVSFDSVEVRIKDEDSISASSTKMYWLEI